jgi:uncharacterized protein YeeX (DUF496 family)
MRVTILLIIALVVFNSCTVSSKIITVKVGEEPKEYTQQMIYSLPQTLYKVRVQLEKQSMIPGPYYIYAEHFLGLKEVITKPSISYRIDKVNVESLSEADPEQFYSINTIKGDFNASGILALSKQGYILDPNNSVKQEFGVFKSETNNGELPSVQGLFLSENLKTVTDTLYKTIITDSSYIQIPIVRSQQEAKTLEQKAEEAAKLIINIRKKKFRLLSGVNEYMPDGKALEIAIKELEKMEDDYVKSFTGRVIKESTIYSFIVVPETDSDLQKYTLSYFSSASGLSKVEGNSYPIVFEVKALNKTQKVEENSTSGLNGENYNQLYYRIPDVAEIRVLLGDYELHKSRQSLWQTGSIVSIPVLEE